MERHDNFRLYLYRSLSSFVNLNNFEGFNIRLLAKMDILGLIQTTNMTAI